MHDVVGQLSYIFELEKGVDAIGKLLKHIFIDLPFQTFGEHINAVMLEDQAANLVETGLRLIGFTDDVIEDEVHVPPC